MNSGLNLHFLILPFRNIFLKKNYQLKLGNFDLSRSLEEADDDESNESLTEHCDTLGYMSPEMRSSKNYSYKTDCWLVLF
jgi:serine/threonine protein kinase